MANATIVGMDQLMSRLNNMKKVGSPSLMREVGETFVAASREIVPVETGALRDSIRVAYAAPRSVGVVAGGPTAPYAQSIEHGARDHQIYPSRARRLNFFWKNPPDGRSRWFNGRAGQPVSHPGNKPQPFFGPVLRGFGGPGGPGGYIRTEGNKLFDMVDMIRADVRNLWNGGA